MQYVFHFACSHKLLFFFSNLKLLCNHLIVCEICTTEKNEKMNWICLLNSVYSHQTIEPNWTELNWIEWIRLFVCKQMLLFIYSYIYVYIELYLSSFPLTLSPLFTGKFIIIVIVIYIIQCTQSTLLTNETMENGGKKFAVASVYPWFSIL